MTTETITWIDVNERFPDVDETVLVYTPRRKIKAVGTGYFKGEWRWENSAPIRIRVSHWAEMPAGPGLNRDRGAK